jgi:hypothetical protein
MPLLFGNTASSGASVAQLIQTSLVWHVDAGSSAANTSSIWYDIIGGNNVTQVSNTGSVTFNNGTGRAGKYYVYNGSSRSLAPHAAAMNTPNGFTAGAWVYTTSNDTTGRIFQKDEISSTRIWEFGNNGGSMRTEVWSSNGNTVLGNGTTVPLNVWHHMVLTCSSNGVSKIYQNGVETGSATISGATGTLITGNTGLYLGGSWGAGEYYTGRISQAYLYNVDLTSTQILQNHNTFKQDYGL